jgi:hypothetical protein
VNLFRRSATAVVAALALSVPTAAITSAAESAPAGVRTAEAPSYAKKAAKPRIKLTRSKAYSHYGQPGVKTTAIVSKGKAKAQGKVTFSVNGTKVATRKLKKGKASYQMAATTAPGTYKITATYKRAKKSASIRVYNSAITVSTTSLTYSKAAIDAFQYSGTAMTGTVNFKDAPANKGYVDIYLNGNVKGGSSSPDYCCMTPVDSATGSFDFSHYQFINDLEERGATPGTTYTYYAFYTDDAGFDDYIYSAPITVTLVP